MRNEGCKGCADRHLGCHGNCEHYMAYKANCERETVAKKRQRIPDDAHAEAVLRIKKKYSRRK